MEKKFSIAEVPIEYKKWFVLARKSISTTRNEVFLEKYYTENFLLARKSKKNGFH